MIYAYRMNFEYIYIFYINIYKDTQIDKNRDRERETESKQYGGSYGIFMYAHQPTKSKLICLKFALRRRIKRGFFGENIFVAKHWGTYLCLVRRLCLFSEANTMIGIG